MGVLSHYLHWRQGAGTHPPEAHFAPGGRRAEAGQHGQLDVLKWLRAQGCDWDDLVCTFAAYGGHQDLITWAVDNGAEMTEEERKAAEERQKRRAASMASSKRRRSKSRHPHRLRLTWRPDD